MKFSSRWTFPFFLCFVSIAVCARGATKPVAGKQDTSSIRPDLVQAKDIVQEAAKKYPHNAELQIQLGFIFKKLGMISDSQRAFKEAVKINPHLTEGHYMLGLIYEYKKETKEALAEWQECLKWATDPETKNTALTHIHHISPSFVVKSKKP